MNRNRSLWCAAIVICMLAAPCLYAQSDAQPSLGEVARRKPAIKAIRVVTNDEIPPSPEANVVPVPKAGTPGVAGASPAAKKDIAPDSAGKQAKIQQLTQENDILQKIIKQMQDKMAATNDPGRISTFSEVVQHAKESLAQNQAEIDKLKAGGAAGSDHGATQAAANQPANVPQAPSK